MGRWRVKSQAPPFRFDAAAPQMQQSCHCSFKLIQRLRANAAIGDHWSVKSNAGDIVLVYSVRFAILTLVGCCLPSIAWAYVDPGILASLTQLLWVAMLGVVGAWVIRPWQYMKGLFRSKESTENTSEVSRESEAGGSSGNQAGPPH